MIPWKINFIGVWLGFPSNASTNPQVSSLLHKHTQKVQRWENLRWPTEQPPISPCWSLDWGKQSSKGEKHKRQISVGHWCGASQWGIDVWPPTLHLRSSGGYVCLSGEPVEGPMDSILLSFSKSHVPPPYHHSPSLLKPITNASGKQSHTLTRIAYQPPLSQFTSHNSCGSSLVYMWHVFTWIQTIQVWAPLSIENMSQINQSFNQSIKRIIRFLFILTEFPILAVQIGYWDR